METTGEFPTVYFGTYPVGVVMAGFGTTVVAGETAEFVWYFETMEFTAAPESMEG